ncbi:beta-galactosidase [Chitinophaga terrae (ex Kim and Jung 2007)]|uniref:glycoside hydrolase family 2 TIM barrel-domain containing protein n=1 Tax=Chitinophaga terrae (ex Kim and Jung 2007) TaxID=408074 RepID=UPI0027842646|nr:glycoside hydrolase family 2 TIM barrel-domain containing protein [Chitinophaga terrae (ex Kim and Jung 2007)]MDQ0109546.1 beta-galactosidase [Chitinophaga terrae (ex Kim and Jung 2007)]
MTKFSYFTLLIIIFSLPGRGQQPVNSRIPFDFDWKFTLNDQTGAEQVQFDDSQWRSLDVPHDFSIEHPFDSSYRSGAGGGYAYGGTGWYRKHFKTTTTLSGKQVDILFDGVYRNSEVWINGHYLGIRPYGYSSFYYDLTRYLNPAGKDNVIAVKVNTREQPNSRWYTGAGIYRHVWLVARNPVHIAQWGVFAHTTEANSDEAKVDISIELDNKKSKVQHCTITAKLIDPSGKVAARAESGVDAQPGVTTSKQNIRVGQPILWSVDQPALYQLSVEVRSGGAITDTYVMPFGIRTARFDADKGFLLNGKHVKLKGVNMHHDGGPLGAAVFNDTYKRRLLLLKQMGCNALRMSHNPPAPELLAYADSLGFVVIDEIFDEWADGKTPAGYSPHFMKWYEKDVENWIKRDRNHASVIAWSLGNEVREQYNKENALKITGMLMAASRQYDDSRPFTAACNEIVNVNNFGMAQMLGMVGYNYQEAFYKTDHEKYPERVIFGSETVIYPYHPGSCWQLRSYDQWLEGQLKDYVAGEFLWTGFDYIGEAGIGDVGSGCDFWKVWPNWPWRGASCGLIDMCDFPKPAYWFRKALWNDTPMVHIAVQTDESARNREVCSFWGWPKVETHWNHNKTGDTLAVHVYTNVPEVELKLNGRSLGVRRWDLKKEAFLFWEVPYEPGKLEAIGKTADGKTVSFAVQTTGEPAKIALSPDREKLKANRQDLCYVAVQLLDANGAPVPFADNDISFEVSGAGKLVAVGNGDQQSHTPLKGDHMEAWQGKCMAIIQSTNRKGKITLTARSKSLPMATTILKAE